MAIAFATAGWMYLRWPDSEAAAAAPLPAPAAPPMAADTRAARAPEPPPSVAPTASAASAQPAPTGPFANESSAELLRKVQLGFGSGSAQEAQEAASVLQFCAQAGKVAESLHAARDTLSIMPAAIRKFVNSFGGISNEQIDRAQSDGRRCQVFDEATLARRGELFQKAYEGGAPGAAMSYLIWLSHDGKAEADPAVVDRLQADVRQLAERGDLGTLTALAFSVDPRPLGMNRIEREACKQAWLRIVGDGNPGSAESNGALIAKLERFSNATPLTAEQLREAQALADQLVDAHRRQRGNGG
ncbi:hypothetical protein [Ideonella sp.]|uniref:hypothetical protein n=1 Tax=Ideonella sp. TaxID=1929293 RepID=UPI002E359699|nr:hypothetical protein [Ideonella sp.]